MIIEDAVAFLADNHPGFSDVPHRIIARLLQTYEQTTIARLDGERLTGLAIYQAWPEQYNFLLICSSKEIAAAQNVRWIRRIVEALKDKPTSWYDESDHKVKELQCHSLHQSSPQ